MWQNWVNGILGLWVAVVMFLDFSTTLTKVLLIISGLLMAVLSFWSASLPKSRTSLKARDSEIIPPPDFSPREGKPAE